MKTLLAYPIEVFVCSGLFLLLYRLLLMRRVEETLCRRYLVGTMVLAVLIPMLELPLYPAEPIPDPFPSSERRIESIEESATAPTTVASPAPAISWRYVIWGCYGTVCLGALLLLLRRLYTIFRLRSEATLTHTPEYTLAESEAIRTPFSFWRTIFMGYGYPPFERTLILHHEQAHVRRHHTLDRLILEGLRILFWFNPFLWIAERWLIEVQEWQADRDTLDEGYEVKSYQTILFRQLTLEGLMLKLKLQYFGHLMRRVDSLEKTLMLGGIGSRRRRG